MSKNETKMPSSFLPAQISNFVGRKNFLQEIENVFIKENKKSVIVLYSFGGTGKSAVASEFGYRFKSINRNYFSYWMKSDDNNLHSEYEKLAEHMNLKKDASENSENLIQKINTKIKYLDDRFKILFIFDNCDNFENIEKYIRNLEKNTFVLITTRDSSLKDKLSEKNSHIIYLQPFTQEESIEFLKNNIDSKVNEEDLVELLNLFGFSNQSIRPYILNKLVALIKLKTKLRTFKTLLNEYKNQKIDDFTRKIINQDEIFDILVKKEPNSWKILKYSSFLDPDFIPIEIYIDMLNMSEDEFSSAFDLLKRISIVTKEEDEHFVGLKLHRALQDEIQQYIKSETDFNSKVTLLVLFNMNNLYTL